MPLNEATEEVLSAIPHRPPFLFVDRVLAITDTSIVAERTLRTEEEFFKGHYPQMPIMPGVLMCEALFQTAGILMSRYLNETDKDGGKIPVLTRIESAKFKQPAFPGDCLRLEVQLTEKMKEFYFFKGNVKKDEKLLITLTFMLGMVPKTSIEP
ncbi:MAG: 3-hydroxyacyl-ACP dehydratase FabZ [Opitutales bacterium]|nr:3-hydroxyacyl-ACP dehydratase FabZ [Opitutales bacterium]